MKKTKAFSLALVSTAAVFYVTGAVIYFTITLIEIFY